MILNPTAMLTKSSSEFEISIHECGKHFLRELQYIFQPVDLKGLLAIPIMQRSKYDLVNFGDVIDQHRDEMLEKFTEFAKDLCAQLTVKGYWADYVDPCSGCPMLTPDCNKVYSEVDGAQILLKYSVQNAGCCKILLHPQYGSAVYPATIFTTAPADVVLEIITPLFIS